MANDPRVDFSHLSYEERLDLIEELWDSIPPEFHGGQLTPEQWAELERRIAEDDADPDAAEDWKLVLRELRDEAARNRKSAA